MKPANVAKKAVKPVLDEAREFVKEVRRQVTGKGSRSEDERPLAVASEKNLTGGSRPEPQQLARLNQFSQQQTDQQLRQLRQEKAELLAQVADQRRRYQRIQADQLAAAKAREEEAVQEKKKEEQAREDEKKQAASASGEAALAATGATQKRPSGLFGLGKGRTRFKWATDTGERKGQAPH